jgi:dihydroflavonol-4-reductase
MTKGPAMQAFVTGGTGFVGAHVIRLLVQHGVKVRALVRPMNNRELLTDLPVELVEGDMTTVESFQHKLRGMDYLFHVAADYRLWVPDPKNMHAVNVQGTERLLEAATEAGVGRVVYTSSAVTVRVPVDRLGSEGDFESPDTCRSIYQRTKVLAEQDVWRMIRAGAPVIIVNPSTPLGPGDRRPTPTGRLIVDYLNRRLPAFLEAHLNWVDVRDVAEGHWLAATRGAVGQRYILGHENLSLAQLFKVLQAVSGVPSPRIRIPYAVAYLAGLVGNAWGRISGHEPQATLDGVRSAGVAMQYDSRKAITELGFPQTPIGIAANEAVHWFRTHGYAPREMRTT